MMLVIHPASIRVSLRLANYQNDTIIILIPLCGFHMAKTAAPDPASYLPLHALEFQVLLVLMEGGLHGYGIAKAIEEKDTRLGQIYPTNLYRRLRDMAKTGLIAEEKANGGGNRRSTFALTTLGHQVAVEEAHRLQGMVTDARRYKLLANRPGNR